MWTCPASRFTSLTQSFFLPPFLSLFLHNRFNTKMVSVTSGHGPYGITHFVHNMERNHLFGIFRLHLYTYFTAYIVLSVRMFCVSVFFSVGSNWNLQSLPQLSLSTLGFSPSQGSCFACVHVRVRMKAAGKTVYHPQPISVSPHHPHPL